MLSAGEPCACLCRNVTAAVLRRWDVSGAGMNQNRSNLIGWAKCPMGDILGSLGYNTRNTTLSQFYAQLWTWLKRPVCRSSPSWSGKQVYWSVLGYHLIVLASGLARNCSAWTVWNQHCSHAARNIVIALVQVHDQATISNVLLCAFLYSQWCVIVQQTYIQNHSATNVVGNQKMRMQWPICTWTCHITI